MKKFFIVIFFLTTLTAYSSILPNPCTSAQLCSLDQLLIWEKFEKSGALNKEIIPSVYSGACYHLSQFFDPSYKHYGVFMFDKFQDHFYNFGQFGFFYEENPYDQLRVDDFRNLPDFSYRPSNQLIMEENQAIADYTVDAENIWRYYIRQEEISNNLLIVGFWSRSHILFCEFAHNPNIYYITRP